MIIRSAQHSFKQTFDNSTQPMLLADARLEKVHAINAAAAIILGYPLDRLKQIGISDIMQIKDEQKQNIQLSYLFGKNQRFKTSFCFMRQDKTVFCATCLITLVCGSDKKRLAYLFSIENMNQCRQEHICNLLEAEKEKIKQLLFSTESRLKAIFNSASDCIFIKDQELRYIDVNPRMEKKFKMPLSTIRGKTDTDLFGSQAARENEEVDRQVLQGKTMSFEHNKNINNIPSTFHIIKVPIKDKQNKIIGICGIARDITSRKQSEDALKKYEIQLEAQNKVLMIKNLALKEIISQIEQEKDKVKQDIIGHIEQEILPLLGKVALRGRAEKYIMLIKKHLTELNSSLRSSKQAADYNFTPREAEISRLIRDGLTSKEIAQLLNITSQTIDKHRQNIRKKLGIDDQAINLTSYLAKR
ncbi:MAG: PAS domain-containing protein [Candidatus Omnitrophica bacterium]|nr:PAS domain-containing protein [Candidatus Omnitrophota bacterium]